MTEKKALRTLRALKRLEVNAAEWQNAIRRNIPGAAEKCHRALEAAENTRTNLVRDGIYPERYHV